MRNGNWIGLDLYFLCLLLFGFQLLAFGLFFFYCFYSCHFFSLLFVIVEARRRFENPHTEKKNPPNCAWIRGYEVGRTSKGLDFKVGGSCRVCLIMTNLKFFFLVYLGFLLVISRWFFVARM